MGKNATQKQTMHALDDTETVTVLRIFHAEGVSQAEAEKRQVFESLINAFISHTKQQKIRPKRRKGWIIQTAYYRKVCCCSCSSVHLFTNLPWPRNSQGILSIFDSRCHLPSCLLPTVQASKCRALLTIELFYCWTSSICCACA